MTTDERLDRLAERHEVLAESVALLSAGTRELKAMIAQDAENIRTLARIAEIQERKITQIEDRQQ